MRGEGRSFCPACSICRSSASTDKNVRSSFPAPILQSAVNEARAAIIADLGSTADLPRELLNTIANIYYQFFLPVESREPTGHDLPTVLKNFINDNASLNAGVEHMPGMIEALRAIDKRTRPDVYDYSVEYYLDILKYKIADAGNKTGIRRMIERKLKRVNEIDDLIEIMHL